MRKRKVINVVGLILLGMAVLITAAPLWYPWLLAPILQRWGVAYDSYHRQGMGRLLLEDVTCSRNGIQFAAREIRVVTPVPYLWNKVRGGRVDVLEVRDWRLQIAAGTRNANHTVYRQFARTESIAARLRQWVPKAKLQNGTVLVRKETINVPSAQWERGVLNAIFDSPRLKQSAAARVDFTQTQAACFSVSAAPGVAGVLRSLGPFNIKGNLTAQRMPGSNFRLVLDSTLKWGSSQAMLSAEFAPGEIIPGSASIVAPAISIPAELVRLPGYQTLSGSVNVNWRTPRFEVDVNATAQPLTSSSAPPATLVLHGSGGTNAFRLDAARIASPWLTADLSQGFEMSFSGGMQSDSASFFLTAVLDRQPWLPVRGQLAGHAFLRRGNQRYPDISAELHGQNIGGFGIEAPSIDLQARLDWPVLKMTRFQAKFANQSGVIASGILNLNERSIIESKARFSGQVPRLVLPRGYSYAGIEATLRAEGAWSDPNHSGEIEIRELRVPGAVPLQTQVRWRGKRLELESLESTIAASNSSRLSFGGSAELGRNAARFLFTRIDLATSGGRYALEEPVIARFARDAGNRADFSAQVDHLRLGGAGGRLALDCSVNWPRSGQVKLSMTNISDEILRDFLTADFPDFKVNQLETAANWDNGPLEFAVLLQSQYEPWRAQETEIAGKAPDALRPWWKFATEPWTVAIQGRGGGQGAVLDKFLVSGQTGPLLSAQGHVSVILHPGRGGDSVEIKYGEPLKLQAKARPDAGFWAWLTEGSSVRATNGWIEAALNGTLERPEGGAGFGMDHLVIGASTNRLPIRADWITAKVAFVEHELRLDQFSAQMEGQVLHAVGQLPLPDRMTSLKSLLDWRKATAHVEAPLMKMTAISRFAPDYLSPQGIARVDVTLRQGLFAGQLNVKGAASRPLPNIGPLQDVNATIKLNGRKLEFEQCSGLLGGAPVSILGTVTIPERLINGTVARAEIKNALASSRDLPMFDLLLRGDSVPLVRRVDFILRAHFDVRVSNTKPGKPIVSGEVTLQNSYYLSDVKLLIPSSVDKPRNRPPFFSIEREPFAGWLLDVSLKGNQFLKVRSPFFTGVVSADFRLAGTLKEPLALGHARVDSGSIQFPFASLNVLQGEVGLTAASPYLPHLLVVASSRVYNYDVRAQIAGAAERPNIEFTSTPGLASEQILLMLTTGEMPLNDSSFTAQQRAGHLAMFVGKNFLNRLGLNLGAEDRLTLRSSQSDIEPGTQAYGFEYKLSKKWSVTGDYDRFGGLNLGLQWRFYSK